MSVDTDANGNYSFTVKPELLTRYRVTAKAKPQVESPVVQVRVRPLVTFAVNDSSARKGQRVTFRGSVFPAHANTGDPNGPVDGLSGNEVARALISMMARSPRAPIKGRIH